MRASALLRSVGAIALVFGVLAGCATTRQAHEVKPSAFLGDYSQLREGERGEAQLVYEAPDANFPSYHSVLIDPVTVWYDSEASRLPAEDEKRLTDYLYVALRREFAKVYFVVDRPGPGVMRLRAAITEAEGANVVGNAVTAVVPQLRTLQNLGGLAADTALVVGRVRGEAELMDSDTSKRLWAAVDARIGKSTLHGGLGKWDQVQEAFDAWATGLSERLAQRRSGSTER